ncbi:S8 family serine peptidase [Telmatocola sphagniphila]|uniref:S8 family serine peptidase n=1 Tax=Telmatocola sphagniphila TaxID=1123043 RepID=A0A8E6EZQ9_9BACT|nr:S8 family serine peptidase [Telmatocola sphagniphila]QVL33731.1 S8 family serine peptidase [Telmatocola sphagniphila]
MWRETRGDPRVSIAILDGPVDWKHPSLAHARLVPLNGSESGEKNWGPASRHGTQVTSLIFGQSNGLVKGIAPNCRGLLSPIFDSAADGTLKPSNQVRLAQAIAAARDAGAQVINISGGMFAPSSQVDPLLAEVIEDCARRNTLIVAAVGNDGCACPHIPAALNSVLAVGALDALGQPLPSSNWDSSYRYHGVVALGHHLTAAVPGSGSAPMSGTSAATAVLSGVVGLLLSLQLKRGLRPNPSQVREAILQSAVDCRKQAAWNCPRLLAGRLNIPGILDILFKETSYMKSASPSETSDALHAFSPSAEDSGGVVASSGVEPSACGCGSNSSVKVYALGRINYSLVSPARITFLKTYMQEYPTKAELKEPPKASEIRNDPKDIGLMVRLLRVAAHEHIAASLEWTLEIEPGIPSYAIKPQGPYAREAYQRLIDALYEFNFGTKIEYIVIPGVISGKAKLLSGQEVPALIPDLRGMFSWNTESLIRRLENVLSEENRAAIRHYFRRSAKLLKNLGVQAEHRALNFALTNAYTHIYAADAKRAGNQGYNSGYSLPEPIMDLETVHVSRSQISAPGTECWDVEIAFFYPHVLNSEQARHIPDRKIYQFKVDVSDVVPVMIGEIHSWNAR